MIDLDKFVESIALRVAELMRPAIAEEVHRALEQRDEMELLDQPALARIMNCSNEALRMRLKRGSVLAQLAVNIDGRRMWRRRDIDALAVSHREPKLRVLP